MSDRQSSSPAWSVPPPPATASPEEHRLWRIEQRTKEAHEVAIDARELAELISTQFKEAVGNEPSTAKGIEGKGMLGAVSKLIERFDKRELEERVVNNTLQIQSSSRRAILTGVGSALGTVAVIVGLVKLAIELFRH